MAILGIDLGTSNSAAGVAMGDEIRMIEPAEGATDEGMVFPSYVAFDAAGNYSCAGIAAKRQFQTAGDFVVRHAKRLIGRSYDYLIREIEQAQVRGHGRRFLDEFKERIERGNTGEVVIRVGKTQTKLYTPQEIARLLLEKIRTDAEPQVYQMVGQKITGAVITTPAGFDDASLRATLWAGEQVFGDGKVQLIPEPLAAALASGVQRDQETIMVVDMGAGTTDIVVGNVIRTHGSFQWVPITQGCDDELGGWDMDYLILEYLLNTDQREPFLRDVYPLLDIRGRSRLMEAIERAKIAVSTADNGQISVVLDVVIDGQPTRKAVMLNMDSKLLKSIVSYKGKRSFEDKGSVVERCRRLVDQTLMELADGNAGRLGEVKQSMDRVILVGGPMRMRSLYDMMAEVFADRPQVLEAFDPLNSFPMECVAKGASQYEGGRILLQVPHTLSLFDWGNSGYVTLIPRGTPYDGAATTSMEIDVNEGTTWIDIITEKENVSLPSYPVREHIVRVPQKGKLEISVNWDTSGCRVGFSGAGLTLTEIPSISDQTTLAEDFKRQFVSLLQSARNLRSMLEDVELRNEVRAMFLERVKQTASDELKMGLNLDMEATLNEYKVRGKPLRQFLDDQVTKLLTVPAEDLARCDAVDPATMSDLKEDEIKLILDKGYSAGAKDRAKARGISEKAFDTISLIRSISKGRVSVSELLMITKALIRKAEHGGANVPGNFVEELKQLRSELKTKTNNRVLIANVSVRMAALADVLYDQGIIPREALQRAKWVAARAEA